MRERPVTAAQYIRMSTDAQDLSPKIQEAAIAAYARREGISIVETYFDGGRSGLRLQNRPAMRRLLRDVTEKSCPFNVVLVYDVSRWGRFQDPDASAYYEYHCRLQGVDVRYVEEPFIDNDTPLVSLLKGMKRVMAAEYSRELGIKTRAGQDLAIRQGFHMGSLPSVGIGRVAVSKQDGSERELAPADHKSSRGEHLKWVPGTKSEIRLVRRIFQLYAQQDISVPELARLLRAEGQTTRAGKPFTQNMLYRVLGCEAYIGNFVWGRYEQPSKRKRLETDKLFHRVGGSISPILDAGLWKAAEKKRSKRAGIHRSREQLLMELQQAFRANPRLTASDLVNSDCASRASYVNAFGSFAAALAALGLSPHVLSSDEYEPANERRLLGSELCDRVVEVLTRLGVSCRRLRPLNGCMSFVVNDQVTVRVQTVWRRLRHGVWMWFLRKSHRSRFDHTLLVRVKEDGTVFDSILLSLPEYRAHKRWFTDSLRPPPLWIKTEAGIASKFNALRPISTEGDSPKESTP